MKNQRILFWAISIALFAALFSIAASLFLFDQPGQRPMRIAGYSLLFLSPLPLVLSFFQSRMLNTAAQLVEQSSIRDPLTGLYNQTTYWDLLGYEIERSRRQNYRISLLLIDIDNFKAINDRYGHDVGDRFLVEFSALLKSSIRKGDIPARFVGDKFAAILPVCEESQAYTVANRLIETLRSFEYDHDDGTKVRDTVSVGIAVFPDHAADAGDLYLIADSMLTHAKSAGKDRLSLPSNEVDISTLRSAGEKSILVMEAIREKRVVPYFQPIMDVGNNTIMAYEVLTRIISGDRVIPAAEFIEAAEGMGAIGKIDYLLIEQAFEKTKTNGYTGSLFLNLSPKALILNEFLPTVRTLMRTYGLEPGQMVFEITERDTVKNLSQLEKHVQDLKDEGFRFAIDDFGSGYSSFLYIKTFQVDFLKVDGEFIRNMPGTNGMERAIVSNIASLASGLGIKTIAEYVETEDILGQVRTVGIDYAQGYYIRRPSPDL